MIEETDSVMVKKSGETLSEETMLWSSLLPENSIYSFNIVANNFLRYHIGVMKF